MEKKKVFIGYDRSEHLAYVVCRKSMLSRASIPLEIIPLRQEALRAAGLYWRFRGPKQSNEFTYSRFLVPALCGYQGAALFVDSDFLFLADVAELFALRDPFYSVQCVHHDHRPPEQEKMGGAVQMRYERKNWTSLMLLNCSHPDVTNRLSVDDVNAQSGAYLLQMQWTIDEFIGKLPEQWNVLSGYTSCDNPKAIHFTSGIKMIHGERFPYNEQHDKLWEKEYAA